MKYEITMDNICKAFNCNKHEAYVPHVAIEKDEVNDTLKIVSQITCTDDFVPKTFIGDKEYSLENVFNLLNYKNYGGWRYFEL